MPPIEVDADANEETPMSTTPSNFLEKKQVSPNLNRPNKKRRLSTMSPSKATEKDSSESDEMDVGEDASESSLKDAIDESDSDESGTDESGSDESDKDELKIGNNFSD
jgi:hypothetical protein